MPGIREAVETVDVSTPATVIRYTGNWCGSQEGWLFKPGEGMKMLPNSLPGLKQFKMVGQWIMPGGGLPSGPMTARPTVKGICKRDRVQFLPPGVWPTAPPAPTEAGRVEEAKREEVSAGRR
jgi:phytoene dehydrogenase-like protein